MPEHGVGSVARFGRRLVALALDYALAGVAALLAAPYERPEWNIATLVIFAMTQVLFIATLGGSIGHRALGMRLVAIDGSWVGWRRPMIRTVLLVLVIPALVWDSDQRGFHDKVAGTVLVVTR
ncbi:MAG: RDD family protein [Agromyces sp.]